MKRTSKRWSVLLPNRLQRRRSNKFLKLNEQRCAPRCPDFLFAGQL